MDQAKSWYSHELVNLKMSSQFSSYVNTALQFKSRHKN